MKYNLTQPFFVKEGAIKMKAISKWKEKSYLKDKFNNCIVNIMRFDSEKDMETLENVSKKKVRFNNYIENLHSKQYLADNTLNNMNIHEDIYKDLYNPYLNGPIKENPKKIVLFIGENTKSGCHIHIEQDWVLHQIVGKKIVYLLPFEELEIKPLYKFNQANFSKKNFFKLDKSKYNIQKIELNPGDMLYIPPWTWHAIENIGYTIAVTKVFERDLDYLKLKKYRKIKHRVYISKFIETIQKLLRKITFN